MSTRDAATTAQSFLEICSDSDFSLQNLPYGVFQPEGQISPRVGVAIGDWVLDLAALEETGLFRDQVSGESSLFAADSLNPFIEKGFAVWQKVRERIHTLLSADEPTLRDDVALRGHSLHKRDSVRMLLPVRVGDYTDFYSSKHHAFNVGTMFRGADNALMPNYLELPVAYHGRASSIIVSGEDIHRPRGQILLPNSDRPVDEPTRQLDYELEMGFFTGPGKPLGERISVDEAEQYIFGFVLVNDWSARDIQRWEYQPLGPFNSKNFATSISPWVVPLAALAPFRIPGETQLPIPLDYLCAKEHWSLDIPINILIQTESMEKPETIATSNYRHLYWTPAQQLTHHTSTGCNIRSGDLLASGTISGPEEDSRGCLLESTWRGEKPLVLPNGEVRTFLQDGDRVTFRASCQGDGLRVGFGEVSAMVLPALE